MAYFIFLKSLRSLGEFRKNPHVKIPPKSPCANFQSIGIFKNSIFIRKEIFFNFRPNRPSGQPAHLAFWPRASRPAEPAHQAESSPLLLPPSLNEPATPLPPLAPPRHGRRASPLPRHGATTMDAPPSLTRSCAFTRT
jgi:hypothetical protein